MSTAYDAVLTVPATSLLRRSQHMKNTVLSILSLLILWHKGRSFAMFRQAVFLFYTCAVGLLCVWGIAQPTAASDYTPIMVGDITIVIPTGEALPLDPSSATSSPRLELDSCPRHLCDPLYSGTVYRFSLDYFKISNTMANHLDTDIVTFTVKVGTTVHGPMSALIGDLNNGTYRLDWQFTDVIEDDNIPVLLTYQIMNRGHADAQQRLREPFLLADRIATAIEGVALTVTAGAGAVHVAGETAAAIGVAEGATVSAGAAVVVTEALAVTALVWSINKAIVQVGEALEWVSSHINCDGQVLSDAILTTGRTLRDWTNSGPYTELRSYTGPDTPWVCGSNAQYAVSWSVTRIGEGLIPNDSDVVWKP